ncbi:NADH-quinone oxidoreductase subunit L [Pyrodictium abyssi]|uniref:NADH-quinone oxidoreductase subunit L n=1 Tax=Pyrodictium abyssi TaxID=54256 RepID=A0ABM8IWN2_9CREN|nr:NADH-quinone oxidoreductase subunit L [Pyrodictium abyssi]
MAVVDAATAGYTAILVPLASAPLAAVAGYLLGRRAAWAIALASAAAALLSSYVLYTSGVEEPLYVEGPRIPLVPGMGIRFSLYIDGLSAFFSMIVGLVGFLVVVYSYSYMEGDPGYTRYYSLLALFIGAMEGLVLAGGLAQLYIFWEIVGLCSFALIAHHYYSPRASAAGVKALLTTRIGDTALLVGIVYAYLAAGSLEYPVLAEAGLSAMWLPLTLAFIGAVAKSAQLPFHVWLPDAMEGPTPVSALIHAATMVKAGVYLLLRMSTLALAGDVVALPSGFLQIVAIVGAATALYAALAAAAQYDAKRLLAYSTMSQLGFIYATIGLAWRAGSEGLAAALEHVASHAVFKALLFLAVGIVIHEFELLFGPEIARDMRYVAGAARGSRLLVAGLVAGAAALAGIPPFNGAWSKEAIIDVAINSDPLAALALLAASAATAFYSAKLVYYLVFAEPRHGGLKVEKPPMAMAAPVLVLAVLAIASPLLLKPPLQAVEPSAGAVAAGLAAASAGLLAAYLLYSGRLEVVVPKTVHRMVLEGFYVDRVYTRIVVPSILFVARMSARGLIGVVDALASTVASLSLQLGEVMRSIHLGKLSYYYAVYLAGLVILIIAALIGVGG